ncbi:GyrI-like domain-containing protein [Nocardia sp. NPDC051990]|uniref:GyrI-like domain-containing protein n=1 Tax=Nocardia sp. NPDC051990 TaxID=3155285 RepID=UPI00344A8BBB
MAVPADPAASAGAVGSEGRPCEFAIVDLPAVSQAATVVHGGSMDEVLEPWQSLGKWIDANGYHRCVGPAHEVTSNTPSTRPAGSHL